MVFHVWGFDVSLGWPILVATVALLLVALISNGVFVYCTVEYVHRDLLLRKDKHTTRGMNCMNLWWVIFVRSSGHQSSLHHSSELRTPYYVSRRIGTVRTYCNTGLKSRRLRWFA